MEVTRTTDEYGKLVVTLHYTEEEKTAMKARAEAHKAEMEKRRADREEQNKHKKQYK